MLLCFLVDFYLGVSMFGKNEIVGQSYFKDAKSNELYVTSMFLTLQGEGPYRGEPAFFIRFSKCQLACSFCDTFFDDGDWLSFDEIEKEIYKTVSDFYGNDNISTMDLGLVITGGEPMLQKNIVPFLQRMNPIFKWTQIESNGLIFQNIPRATTLVVSPKCLEKNGEAVRYLSPNEKVLKKADCLKFVMCADPNSPYSSIPDWAFTWHKTTENPVFISPMNIYNSEPKKTKIDTVDSRSKVDEVISFWEPGLLNMEENKKNHEYTAKYCLKHGFTFNMQLHLFASLA